MKNGLAIAFWISIACIVLAFFFLVIFKLLKFSSTSAAFIVATFAFIGGAMLIVSSIFLFIQNKLPIVWMKRLELHLPEFIALGLAFIILAIVLFIGKRLK